MAINSSRATVMWLQNPGIFRCITVGLFVIGAMAIGPRAYAGSIGPNDFQGGETVQSYEGLELLLLGNLRTPLIIGGDTYTTDDGCLQYIITFNGPCLDTECIGNCTDLGFIDVTLGTPVKRVGGFVAALSPFGINITPWSATVDFFDQTDTLLGTVNVSGEAEELGFAGWEADAGLIKRIRFIDTASNDRFLVLDNLTTETPMAALAYYGLGDSVAAGHGLPEDDGQKLCTCRRSSLAYPYRVRDFLQTLLPEGETVRFSHLACSGAQSVSADEPNSSCANRFDPIDFPQQVDQLLAEPFPAGQITLVSITIGANDFDFVRESFLGEHLCAPDYQSWISTVSSQIQQQLIDQLQKIIQQESVYVVLTDYFNPYNRESGFFDLMRSRRFIPGFGKPNKKCRKLSDQDLYNRTADLVQALNAAINNAAAAVGRPDRIAVASLHNTFQGRESAQPNCGGALPDKFTTWIQYAPAPLPGHFGLWLNMRRGNDCIHPNVKGARAYALVVYNIARQLLPLLP